MADLSYKVTVDTVNARNSINTLKSGLLGLAAAFSIKEITQFGDSITTVKNRLMSLGASTRDVERQFAAVAEIATTARAPLDAVGDVYFRIQRAADSLGISQREVADITMSLSKAMTASGISAQEAAGPLMQIGQALQSGRFQGDELRSVLEGMPAVTQALAAELGVTIGELKKLGSEGVITGEVFVNAMRKAKGSIDDAFSKTLPTIGQSFEVLRTKMAVFFDTFEQNTGLFAKFAALVLATADSLVGLSEAYKRNAEGINTLLKVLAMLAASYLTIFRIVPGLARAQDALFLAFNKGPTIFAKLTTSIIGVKAGIVAFGTNLAKATGLMTGAATSSAYLTAAIGGLAKAFLRLLGWVGIVYAIAEAIDYLIVKFTNLGSPLDWLAEKFNELGRYTGMWGDKTEEAAAKAKSALDKLSTEKKKSEERAAAALAEATALEKVAAGLVKAAKGYFDLADEQTRSLRLSTEQLTQSQSQIDLTTELRNAEVAYLNESQRLNEELGKLKYSTKKEELGQIGLLQSQLIALNKRYKEQQVTVNALAVAHEKAVRVRNLQLYSIDQELKKNKELSKIQDDIAKLTMTKIEQGYYDIAAAARDSARAAIQAEEARRGNKLDPEEATKYYEEAAKGARAVQREHDILIQQSRTFETGWKSAWNQYIENARDAAGQATSLFNNAMKGMEDMIVNFVKTGKLEWKDLFASMAEELLRNKIKEGFASLMDELSSGTGVIGQIGEMFGLKGMSTGSTKGSSANNPMYVYDVASGAGGAISKVMGGGSSSGGNGTTGIGSAIGSVFGPVGAAVGGMVEKAAGGLGGVVSGVVDFVKDLWPFADGGIVTKPMMGLVGEAGPEAIIPLDRISEMMGGGTTVVYNINAVDARSFQ
ncbi:tape measure protein, partial [bacterium]|nr:tape measure protein [bacterium]